MSKTIWGAGVTACFALFIAAPTASSDAFWKTPVLVFSTCGCVGFAIGWLRAFFRESKPQRGDLHLTVLNIDYHDKTAELVADLMFFNNDSIQRTVLGDFPL